MIYILKMDNPKSPDDTGLPTRVRLIGPFGTIEDRDRAMDDRIQAWIAANNPHDNPCWQVVDLTLNGSKPTGCLIKIEAPRHAT